MIGMSLGFVGLMVALVQGVLIRKIIPIIGEQNSIYTGLSLYLIGFLLFACCVLVVCCVLFDCCFACCFACCLIVVLVV